MAIWTSNGRLTHPNGSDNGLAMVDKFGRNEDVDSAASEDIWDAGGTWVAPTAARLHDIASTDAADTSAGTGMRTVTIEGLDSSWEPQSETITLNGTSDVSTVNTYVRIFRMYGATFGSGETNAGDITATADTDATVTAQITAEVGQTLMAIYTVPAGKTAHLTHVNGVLNKPSGGASANIVISLHARRDADTATAGWRIQWVGGVSVTGSSSVQEQREPYTSFPEKTDLKLRAADGTSNNLDVSGRFGLLLVDN